MGTTIYFYKTLSPPTFLPLPLSWMTRRQAGKSVCGMAASLSCSSLSQLAGVRQIQDRVLPHEPYGPASECVGTPALSGVGLILWLL